MQSRSIRVFLWSCFRPSLLVGVLIATQPAKPDFWSLRETKPETVTLVRKLPPVASRNGNTVRFIAEVAGNSIPVETATIVRDQIRTLLLNTKAGAIQLVDGPADTVIKCIITGYEPKVMHPGQRQVGLHHQQIVTWIGNVEASVQVFDSQERPLDAANIKEHLENDFVVAESEEHVAAVTDKRHSWRDKLGGGIKVFKGGDKADVAELAGGGQQMHDALSGAEGKGAREPTDLEWRTALFEALAAKVANRIVPVDQEFIAILPLDKEFGQARELAKSNRWGDVQEQMEKMTPLEGGKDAFRQYLLGLSYEAMAYVGTSPLEEAAEALNKASKYYADSRKLNPRERELLLAQIRAQDSLDHYLEIEHFVQTRSRTADPPKPEKSPVAPVTDKDENVADNDALIAMVAAKLPETILVNFVRNAPDPKFDVSANGLLKLVKAGVPATVIEEVQRRSAPAPAPPRPPKGAPRPPAAHRQVK